MTFGRPCGVDYAKNPSREGEEQMRKFTAAKGFRTSSADVVKVHDVVLEPVGLDLTEARILQHRQRQLLAPGGAQAVAALGERYGHAVRSEEHTSELQSLMRISYAVFCLKKKNKQY